MGFRNSFRFHRFAGISGRAGLLWLVLLFLSHELRAEEWTDRLGRPFVADFVQVDGISVIFELDSGRRFSKPLADLGQADQLRIQRGMGRRIEDLRSNFGRPWPLRTGPRDGVACKAVSEDPARGEFVYESPGYRFHSDTRITHEALANFATIFEGTRAFMKELPLSLLGGESNGTRSKVLLFGSMASYHRAGGPVGSAGCYHTPGRVVMVPMESLGLAKGGTGIGRDLSRNDVILVHELAHQLTPDAYYVSGALGWFTEGLAEYAASTPFHLGIFRPDPHGNAVAAYVSGHGLDGKGGRNLGKDIVSRRLRNLMLMDYRDFVGRDGNLNYGVGLLLTHYFFHMEGNGDARRMAAFLKGLHEGKNGETALQPLLGGSTFEKLEEQFAGAWARKGIRIRFVD